MRTVCGVYICTHVRDTFVYEREIESVPEKSHSCLHSKRGVYVCTRARESMGYIYACASFVYCMSHTPHFKSHIKYRMIHESRAIFQAHTTFRCVTKFTIPVEEEFRADLPRTVGAEDPRVTDVLGVAGQRDEAKGGDEVVLLAQGGLAFCVCVCVCVCVRVCVRENVCVCVCKT